MLYTFHGLRFVVIEYISKGPKFINIFCSAGQFLQ